MSNQKVNPIPEGYNNVIPYLICKGADKVVDFMKKTFNAEEMDMMKDDNGTIMHASYRIGDSVIMLSEGGGNMPPMPCMLYVYVDDVDAAYKRALDCGSESVREPKNEFYGDRSGGVKDSSGNQWWIGTHIEDVSPEEMKKREEEWRKSQPKS